MKHLDLKVLVAVALAAASAAVQGAPGELPRPATDADYHDGGAPPPAKVELGRLLFFDKILSGNLNIACSTCHHPDLATGDGLALPLGEGPRGLGADRRPGPGLGETIHERVPRNSPPLFNLGAREYGRMFADGRVELDPAGHYRGGFITPAKWKLWPGLDNLLAAQAMFPVASPTEMAGQKGENPIADAVSLNNVAGPGGVWEQLGARLAAIPHYVDLFREAFPEMVRSREDVNFVLAANAIAAFEAVAFRADDSPFDRYLRGSEESLGEQARRGMDLFYGPAGCATCHSGTFQTDHDFHAIAMPQIGPGKGDGADASYWQATGISARIEDFGRGRVTVRPEDRYAFRTPSLRNVASTGPWGHAGAYATLEAAVRHHLDPVASLEAYELPSDLLVPLPAVAEITAQGSRLHQALLSGSRLEGFRRRDGWVQADDGLRRRLAAANELAPSHLSDREVADLLAFLESLTDLSFGEVEGLVPDAVPSGLPVAD